MRIAPFASFTLGLLLGAATIAALLSIRSTPPTSHQPALKAELDQLRENFSKSQSQIDGWKSEVDRLSRQAAEVHRLRAEIADLKRQTALAASHPAPSVPSPTTRPDLKANPEAKSALGKDGKIQPASLSIDLIPLAARDAILREFPNAADGHIFVRQSEGRTLYGVKGQTPDGRGIALNVSEDGQILARTAEVPVDVIPENIRSVAAQMLGNNPPTHAREVVDGDQIRYEFNSKNPDSSIEMSVRADGTVLSYATRLRTATDKAVKK